MDSYKPLFSFKNRDFHYYIVENHAKLDIVVQRISIYADWHGAGMDKLCENFVGYLVTVG